MNIMGVKQMYPFLGRDVILTRFPINSRNNAKQ